MGVHSVYCNFSNITIANLGHEIVLVPLVKQYGTFGYNDYTPLGLPIFGTYDEQGCIENIEPSIATEIIEKVYQMPIRDFCERLTHGSREGFEDVEFCWVDREVWNVMSSEIKHSEFKAKITGSIHQLRTIGIDPLAKHLRDNYDRNIHLKEIGMEHIIQYFPPSFQMASAMIEAPPSVMLKEKYMSQDENQDFLDLLHKLNVVLLNAYSFSASFQPMKRCVAPQFGEYEAHDYFLKAFQKINESYVEKETD